MRKWENFIEHTDQKPPRFNVVNFVEDKDNIEIHEGKAYDIGCGAGSDSILLVLNGWNVTAIDAENVGERIKNKIPEELKDNFKFESQRFEELNLEECDLVVANNSLPFCEKNHFDEMWNHIASKIKPGGYFVGNFFGMKDEWVGKRDDCNFVEYDKIIDMFKDFELINFNSKVQDSMLAQGTMKHWHRYEITARKKYITSAK